MHVNACSFCAKPEDQVKRLIAGGPGVFICERCIALCSTLIAQEATGIPKTGDTEPDFKVTAIPQAAELAKWSPPSAPGGATAVPPAPLPPAFKPTPGREMPRFAGIATFFRLPLWEKVQGADVAILGVPLDAGTTYRPGAR